MRVPQDAAIYLHREPVDFRKQINGLAVIVESAMELSPFAEAFFLFRNRRGDQVKVLYWERNGFCLWQKRLEQHRFVWPTARTELIEGARLRSPGEIAAEVEAEMASEGTAGYSTVSATAYVRADRDAR
jgi:transposase